MAPSTYTMPMGQALSLGLGTALKNLIPFASLALLIYSPWIAVMVMQPDPMAQEASSRPDPTAMLWTLAALLLPLILNNIAAGALSYGVVQQLRGKRAGIGDCLRRGFSSLPAVLATGMLSGMRIFLFTLLLIIPGIREACRLWVAVPATVAERAGPGRAIQRSIDLTAGSRGAVFGVIFVIGMVSWLLGALEAMLTLRSHTAYLICSVASSLLLSVWSATSSAVGYFLLRKGKENLDLEELAKVFG
jgi:hypothetical protein